MPRTSLPGTNDAVDLGDGYAITAPNVSATVQATEGGGSGARALGATSFDALLEAAGLEKRRTVAIESPVAAPGARSLPEGVATMTLDVPHEPDEDAVVLLEHEDGSVHWHFPEARTIGSPGAARGLEGASRFVIPLRPAAGQAGARGLGGIGDKIMKVFVYPVTDAILGPIVKGFARKWEEHNRPYLVRDYGPSDYKDDRKDVPALADADWQRLGSGRALLFVHGTFSSAGAFSAIAPEVMAALSDKYEGRVFAFNHYTMSADPRENALELLKRIPAGVQLDVDIVCHSRGGLVARELALLGAAQQGPGGSLRVGTIVLVGVPNAGTALTDADHMMDMIDRFTNVAKLIPSASVQKIVDAVVTVLKVLGHGFLDDLTGLRAMSPPPGGSFLRGLNVPGGTAPRLFAITSNYDPPEGTPWYSVTHVENGAADAVFSDEPNDLVVPTRGVFAANGAGGFPVPGANVYMFGKSDGIIHTEYFSSIITQQRLVDWLGATGAARGTGGLMSRDLRRARALSAAELSPDDLQSLRPHVVDMREGRFRTSGSFYTLPADVDAIFDRHIPEWLGARPEGEPARLVFYAHGGLTGERDGLGIAQKHVAWWKQNGVYPIYFVWETGLCDALRSILEQAAAHVTGRRDLFDWTTDKLIEEICALVGGDKIWGAMKSSAQLASVTDSGAADYVAKRLKMFADNGNRGGRPLELHAVGHSAGSIFHAYFLPIARARGIQPFTTTQFLAPAIRIDEFKQRLQPLVGQGAGKLTMYAMNRDLEKADNCAGIYRKSLLYLVANALETHRPTPILGLQEYVRADRAMQQLFESTPANPSASVVWSKTQAASGQSASRSSSHGGFDDDPATMSSVVARVLNEDRARVPYPGSRALVDDWAPSAEVRDIMGTVAAFAPPPQPSPVSQPDATVSQPEPLASVTNGVAHPNGRTSHAHGTTPPSGRVSTGGKRALCVGINKYPPPNTLAGCVEDTRNWGELLQSMNYDVHYLRDREATHSAITQGLTALISGASAGDHLVFQYSGHGTLVTDVDGDEGGGPDQALVPVDFGDGNFLVDDDVRAILMQLREGVQLTVFIDCCHSATITRMLGRTPPPPPKESRRRCLVPTDDQMRRYERYRQNMLNSTRGLPRELVDKTVLRWVNFSACQKGESAYETNGSGDFTRQAMQLLRRGINGLTNEDFQRRLVEAFGDQRRQTPYLDCTTGDEKLPLLGSIPAAGGVAPPRGFSLNPRDGNGRDATIARSLRQFANQLDPEA